MVILIFAVEGVLILQYFEFVVEIASKRPGVCAPELEKGTVVWIIVLKI
jgi:hypothetical protein